MARGARAAGPRCPGSALVAGLAPGQRQVGLLPAADAAIEHVHLLETGLLQALGGGTRGLPGLAHQHQRSEERRVGKECVSTCRYRWSRHPSKKKKNKSK